MLPHAAVKVGGERLTGGRAGARRWTGRSAIEIHGLGVVEDHGEGIVTLEVEVFAGTYVRRLAADIGERLVRRTSPRCGAPRSARCRCGTPWRRTRSAPAPG